VIATRIEDAKVIVLDGDAVVAKLYFSPEGDKLRVVLAELENFAQVVIRPELKIVDFTRDARRAQREAREMNSGVRRGKRG